MVWGAGQFTECHYAGCPLEVKGVKWEAVEDLESGAVLSVNWTEPPPAVKLDPAGPGDLIRAIWEDLDANKDGYITYEEFGKMLRSNGEDDRANWRSLMMRMDRRTCAEKAEKQTGVMDYKMFYEFALANGIGESYT